MENLHKSDEGWRRFRDRTDNGAKAHRAQMRHLVRRYRPEAVVVNDCPWCDADGQCTAPGECYIADLPEQEPFTMPD